MVDIINNRTYVIVSKWAYPFGGGESFLFTTMEWAKKLNMNTYWLCFSEANNKPFKDLVVENHDCGKIIKIPGGFSKVSLTLWLKLLNPDFVHHQGHLRKEFFEPCQKLRIEFFSGFHFWTGAIILNQINKNINILENYSKHEPDGELEYLYNKKYCNLYTVTPFVSQCIKKITNIDIPDHIYSSSSTSSTKIYGMDITKNKFVTMINIHKLKGGEIFLYLIENCPNISFLGIKTEYFSEELDDKIKVAMDKHNKLNNGTQCMLLNRVNNPKVIYQQTQILLVPSLVDETFCRVVNEAMMNGIPVISTGQGNIKFLMANSGYIINADDKDKWENTLKALYNKPNILIKASEKTLEDYKNYSEKKAFMLFKQLVTKIILKSKENNIMIFTPWCDQGLGIQSRNYYNILKNSQYNASIFAIKPYNSDSCIKLQKNPEEWVVENIYYSSKDREHVTDNEIINFIKKYNIGKCLIPETCWFRVFEIAKLLKEHDVKCYGIPNIEIVRKDEIFKHRFFHKLLCNNNLCKQIFNDYGITNTKYIGYGLSGNEVEYNAKDLNVENNIKFLFIGGMNAFSRKHILEICEGFVIAYNKCKNISLTCTIQKTNLLEIETQNELKKYTNHPAINFIKTHMSYKEIIDLYHKNHISIQVSKHEGLGLGFYESLCTGTPIITLDTPPHNEIVKNDINGWTIPCYYKKMTDNKDPLFDSAYFKPDILADKIVNIAENNFLEKYGEMSQKLIIDFTDRLHITQFKNRFLNSIND